jgi:hypothetical protein
VLLDGPKRILERIAADVASACEKLGVANGNEAHRTAWAEEARGYTARTRALHQIAVANGAHARAIRRITNGGRGRQSIDWYVREAEIERDEMVRLVNELTEAEAAE